MKLTLVQLAFTVLIFLTFFTISCTSKKNNLVFNNSYPETKYPYEIADSTLRNLKKGRADTIIFYKRTCINCCDFYYIFWESKGEKFLDKFYGVYNPRQTHFLRMKLRDDKIIDNLSKNYDELKNTSIKDNGHMYEDSSWSMGNSLDHYCYIQLIVSTKPESFEMKATDHDFDKYTDYDFNPEKNRETNDNYLENINSKWNILLTRIERQIVSLPETDKWELDHLRTKNHNTILR